MSIVLFTPAARLDLSSIWDYAAERWDAPQAETYIGELRAAIERVAEAKLATIFEAATADMRSEVIWCSVSPRISGST